MSKPTPEQMRQREATAMFRRIQSPPWRAGGLRVTVPRRHLTYLSAFDPEAGLSVRDLSTLARRADRDGRHDLAHALRAVIVTGRGYSIRPERTRR